MTNTEPIYIKSLQNLQLHVHVIGYYPLGECILIVLYDKADNVVVKSILVDCYVGNIGKDQLSKKLNEYGISSDNPLDMIIWTHPDQDHSKGIGIIAQQFTGKNTYMVLPDGFSFKMPWKAGIISSIQLLLARGRTGFTMERVNTSTHRKNPDEYMSLQFDDGVMKPIECSIEILTPNGAQVIRKVDGKKKLHNNDISISMIVHCGDLDLYLGGDVENDAIKVVPDYKMSKVCFVKIPHHASDTSIELCDVINRNNELKKSNNEYLIDITAVSTCYQLGRNRLPQEEVLRIYKSFTKEIYLTDNKQQRVDGYGICSFVYDVVAKEYIATCDGDAGIWQ